MTDHKTKLQSVQDESKQVKNQLDDNMSSRINELQKAVDELQRSGKADYTKLQEKLAAQMEDSDSKQSQKLVRVNFFFNKMDK